MTPAWNHSPFEAVDPCVAVACLKKFHRIVQKGGRSLEEGEARIVISHSTPTTALVRAEGAVTWITRADLRCRQSAAPLAYIKIVDR